jgi:curli biogenesis system outer membrane secretion channel CsgG
MQFSRYSFVLLFGAVLFFTGCAQEAVGIKALSPAQVSQMANAKRVAVVPFKNDKVGLTGEIESLLANQKVDGRPYFTLLSRTNLKRVIAEQKLQSSQLVNANTATKIGEIIGAQALITGSMSIQNGVSKHYYQSRKECLRYSKENGLCVYWHFYRVTCHTTQATVAANINIVNVETGSVIYGDTISKNYSGDSCAGSNNQILGLLGIQTNSQQHVLSSGQALNQLSLAVAREFVAKLVPHYIYFRVKLLEDIKIDVTSEQKTRLKNAILYIKANRLHKAQKLLLGLMQDLNGKSYVVAYDTGVVSEALGELKKAEEYYTVADNLTNKPIPAIDSALVRIRASISKQNEAMSQINAK